MEDLTARAEAGDGEAMVRLANRLLDPAWPDADPEGGRGWLRRAAAEGHPMGLMVLGQRLLFGLGLPADAAEGARHLRAAAEAGFPPAMEAWGRHRLPDDATEGAAWLRRAADAGFAPAMAAWARCLLDGVGTARDEAAADAWLTAGMAANLGEAFAMAAEQRLAADPAEGERLLAEALRRRDAGAGLVLGLRRYERGEFTGAASAWAACMKLGVAAAAVNVAAMARRGEWPAERPAVDVEALLTPLAAGGEPFAVVNLALWRAARGDAAAGAPVAGLAPGPGREAVRAWWAGLAAAGDPEGPIVLSWLSETTA